MLKIIVPSGELYDERSNEFISTKQQVLHLEHSLVSLSKWESKWCKPFLSKETKTTEETIDYIKCMVITKNVDDNVYRFISNENISLVRDYIDAKMTATTFGNEKKNGSIQIITAELIYYWMIQMNIPFECQKWHLNRLMTLINVCSIKNAPAKKMSKRDIMSRNAAINAARKNELNTKG